MPGFLQTLELTIPPPIVALTLAAAMWGVSSITSPIALPASSRIVATVLALIGFSLAFAGIVSFLRAKTTIHPTTPEAATSLVTNGLYRFTRNPMYLGLVIVLIAWAVFLSNAWTLAGPLLAVLYLNRFQIAPEERALDALFGADYAAYKRNVRRWL
jgi:protein-S-isoprenylcysteine O-methyltransferase Ste14